MDYLLVPNFPQSCLSEKGALMSEMSSGRGQDFDSSICNILELEHHFSSLGIAELELNVWCRLSGIV